MWTSDEASRERLDDLTSQMIDVQTDLREMRARVGDLESLPLRVAERPDRVTVAALVLVELSVVVQFVVLVGLLLGWWGE